MSYFSYFAHRIPLSCEKSWRWELSSGETALRVLIYFRTWEDGNTRESGRRDMGLSLCFLMPLGSSYRILDKSSHPLCNLKVLVKPLLVKDDQVWVASCYREDRRTSSRTLTHARDSQFQAHSSTSLPRPGMSQRKFNRNFFCFTSAWPLYEVLLLERVATAPLPNSS